MYVYVCACVCVRVCLCNMYIHTQFLRGPEDIKAYDSKHNHNFNTDRFQYAKQVCWCVCVNVCMHVCMFVYIYTCVCAFVHIYIYMCVYAYVCVCVWARKKTRTLTDKHTRIHAQIAHAVFAALNALPAHKRYDV